MREMFIKFGFYLFVVAVAGMISDKTRMEGDFPVLAALGIIIVQNMFIRWALMAREDKAEEAAEESRLKPKLPQ